MLGERVRERGGVGGEGEGRRGGFEHFLSAVSEGSRSTSLVEIGFSITTVIYAKRKFIVVFL